MINVNVEATKSYIKSGKIVPKQKWKIGLVFYKVNGRAPCMITSQIKRLDLETGVVKSHFHYNYLSKVRYICSEDRLEAVESKGWYDSTWGKFLPEVILEAVEDEKVLF